MENSATKVPVGEFVGEEEGISNKISRKNTVIAVLEEWKKLPNLPTAEKIKSLFRKGRGLTQKRQAKDIQWTSECQVAFDHLKRARTSGPVLVAPDFNQEFIICTDMLKVGLGAVLCQADDSGGLHSVTFISRRLQPDERHLSAVEKACLSYRRCKS